MKKLRCTEKPDEGRSQNYAKVIQRIFAATLARFVDRRWN